jgi:hypothetical protein
MPGSIPKVSGVLKDALSDNGTDGKTLHWSRLSPREGANRSAARGGGGRSQPLATPRPPPDPRVGAQHRPMPPSGVRADAVHPPPPCAAAAQCRPLAAPLRPPIGLGLRAFQTWRSASGGRGRLAPGAPRTRPARGWMSALTASTRCWPCTRPACLPSPTPTRPASTTWPSTRAS